MLSGVADAVLPAVLSLLRSRSREVIKAVLGFVKVCPMSACLSSTDVAGQTLPVPLYETKTKPQQPIPALIKRHLVAQAPMRTSCSHVSSQRI